MRASSAPPERSYSLVRAVHPCQSVGDSGLSSAEIIVTIIAIVIIVIIVIIVSIVIIVILLIIILIIIITIVMIVMYRRHKSTYRY